MLGGWKPGLWRALSVGLLLVHPVVLTAQVLVSEDFETASAFSNNFRFTFNSSTTATTQTSNGAGNDYVRTTVSLNTDNEIFVYDTTPADGTVKNTFSGAVSIGASIRGGTAGASFGIFIINPTNEGGSVHQLMLFNWDVSGVNDRMRLFNNTAINGSTVPSPSFDSGTTVNSGANAGDTSFAQMTLTYRADTVDASRAVFNLTVGTMSSGDVLLGAGSYLSNFEIGLRSYDPTTAAGATDFDNFTVTQIPEPSTYVLLGLGLGVICLGLRKQTAPRSVR